MADSAAAAVDAGCCIFCVQALSSFCFLKRYGEGSSTSAPCGGPRGCCGSCLDKEPDEDSFDRAQRKERERRMKREAQSQPEKDSRGQDGVVDSQPERASAMQPPCSEPASRH